MNYWTFIQSKKGSSAVGDTMWHSMCHYFDNARGDDTISMSIQAGQ